ncbi:MAG: hypothetical protein IJI66_00050 [Erysipelotrichaceae bacterium]|nr:hypothetical protein [Erysipelotrichaceae bacterium]
MCKILLSINPEHVNNILNGNKIYEFRKTSAKMPVDKLFIYCTKPVKKVVGFAEVSEIINGNPEEVWDKTKNGAGISKKFYDDYYLGRNKAVAYKLKKVNAFKEPKDLSYYGIHNAPQSYVYID